MKKSIEQIEREESFADREDIWRATFLEAISLSFVFGVIVGLLLSIAWG